MTTDSELKVAPLVRVLAKVFTILMLLYVTDGSHKLLFVPALGDLPARYLALPFGLPSVPFQ